MNDGNDDGDYDNCAKAVRFYPAIVKLFLYRQQCIIIISSTQSNHFLFLHTHTLADTNASM